MHKVCLNWPYGSGEEFKEKEKRKKKLPWQRQHDIKFYQRSSPQAIGSSELTRLYHNIMNRWHCHLRRSSADVNLVTSLACCTLSWFRNSPVAANMVLKIHITHSIPFILEISWLRGDHETYQAVSMTLGGI